MSGQQRQDSCKRALPVTCTFTCAREGEWRRWWHALAHQRQAPATAGAVRTRIQPILKNFKKWACSACRESAPSRPGSSRVGHMRRKYRFKRGLFCLTAVLSGSSLRGPMLVRAAGTNFVGNIAEPYRLLQVPQCCRMCPEGFETGRPQQVAPSTKSYDGLPKTASLLVELGTEQRGIYDTKINDMMKREMCYRKGSDQARLQEMHNLIPCCPVCSQQFVPMPYEYQWQSPNGFYLSSLVEVGSERDRQSHHRKKGFSPATQDVFRDPLVLNRQMRRRFLETSSQVSSAFDPTLRFPSDTSKGGCCSVCDRDDEAQYPKTLGGKAFHPKVYPAFVEVREGGRLSKSAKTGYSILDDGCCNTCSGNDLEPPEQRYSEPHGGPFGLLPRLEGIHVQGLADPRKIAPGFDLSQICREDARKGDSYPLHKVDQDMLHARPIQSGM